MAGKKRKDKTPPQPDRSSVPRGPEDVVPPPEPPPRDPGTVGDPPTDEPGASALDDPERAAPARGQPDHEPDEVF